MSEDVDNGKIVALRFEAFQNNGAYHQLLTPSISHLTVFMVPGCYDIQDISITMNQAFTNTTPTDAYRGAGRPEATHGVERLMDAIADDLGMDPAEVRRVNFIKQEQFPYSSSTGLIYDSGEYHGTLDKALEPRKGRARWRTKLVENNALRQIRTTLLGHMTGWMPPVHAVGPWRPVSLIEQTPGLQVRAVDLRATLEGEDGLLVLALDFIRCEGHPPASVEVGAVSAVAWPPSYSAA